MSSVGIGIENLLFPGEDCGSGLEDLVKLVGGQRAKAFDREFPGALTS